MMKMSVTMNCMIPLMCHFMHMRGIANSSEFILTVYDALFDLYENKYGVDVYNKLYETADSNVRRTAKRNQIIWNMQDIRGINTSIHTLQSIHNIVINIMPKYKYDGNLVHLNYKSIIRNTGFQILDNEYEFTFISLSSSIRDEDMNSEFDKFSATTAKTDEALVLQNQVACDEAMHQIIMQYGPFDEDEMMFYKKRLSDGVNSSINSFQKKMIFLLFSKYFSDYNTIHAINRDDYIILIMAAKRILEQYGLIILPWIISAKVVRLSMRKNINKKELIKIESSPLWEKIKNKYRNEKLEKELLSMIATILTSDFEIIDPQDEEMDGKVINVMPEFVCEEMLIYADLI